MTTLPTVTDTTFEQQVSQATGPVLVEFGADWCPPCHALAPVLEAVAREYAGTLTVLTLDVDANPDTTARYGVRNLPTLILFDAGQPVTQLVGARPKATLLRDLAPHLPAANLA